MDRRKRFVIQVNAMKRTVSVNTATKSLHSPTILTLFGEKVSNSRR
jgi:hypothetical protein